MAEEDFLNFDFEQLDELRDRLKKVGEFRKQADWTRGEAKAMLQSAVIEAHGLLSITEIARLTGVSRRAVYDTLAYVEPYLE